MITSQSEVGIPLCLIAKALDIRLKRLSQKVHKLHLNTTGEGTNLVLSEQSACTLVEDYAQSSRSSERTKINAANHLEQIKMGTVPFEAVDNKVTKQIQQPKKKAKVRSKRYRIQKLVPDLLYIGVQSLESVYFKFVALIVAIFVQMQHSANWFYRIAPDESASYWAAYGYAFMVDLFILVVTMEGRIRIAKTFAVLTFLSNLLYFQFWVYFDFSKEAFTHGFSSILISGIIAYIIYSYTDLFVQQQKEN